MAYPMIDADAVGAEAKQRRGRWRTKLGGGLVLAGLLGSALAAPPALAATNVDYLTRQIAGTGSNSCQSAPTPGPATSSQFCAITSTVVAANGDIYAIDQGYRLIYKISGGVLSVVAGGGGTYGTSTPALQATFQGVYGGVLVGNDLYFTDPDQPRVYRMDITTGSLTSIAGTGAYTNNGPYYLPAFGGLATSTPLGYPMDLAVDPDTRDVYLVDAQGAVEKIDGTTGILSLVAGSPGSSTVPTTTPTPAASTKIWYPETLALAPDGTLYVGNPYFAGSSQMSAIYKITTDGNISLFAGNGQDAASVNGPALNSPLQRLKSLRVSSTGQLYAALNSQIVAIDPTGNLEVIAGTGSVGSATTFGSSSTTSGMYQATGLSFGPDCSVYLNTGVNRYLAQLEPQQPCALAAPTATAGNASATLTWPAPTASGATPVSDYIVTPYIAGVAQTPVTFNSTATTQTLIGLTNGTAYAFTITPVNASGPGDASAVSNTATPTAPVVAPVPNPAPVNLNPGPPTLLSAVGAGTAATVSFAAPTRTGSTPISGYRVTATGGDLTSPRTVDGATSPVTIGGLSSGQTYTFTVAALNSSGVGATSNSLSARWEATTVPVAPGVTRLAGNDRAETATTVSKALFPADGRATAAVIATSRTYADSIGGSRLASAVQGPLLLSDTAALQAGVAAEIRRTVTPGGQVYILGNNNALSQSVRDTISELDSTYTITRLGGVDRFATAVTIADTVTTYTAKPASPTQAPIYLASGTNYPDGLAVAALAGKTGGVVLLTDGATLPAATATYLAAHDPTGVRTTTVGGPAAAAYPRAATSLVGLDRYETSALIAERFPTATTTVGLASGANWPDALVGAAAMGIIGGPVLLTEPGTLSPATRNVIDATQNLTSSWVFGGPTSLSTTTENQVKALLRPTP